jgi:GNAT superfamily N-acetyltransferase
VSDTTAFIAGLDTEAVGCVLARPKGDHLYFGRLSVRPQHRSRGVAAALVTAVETEARRRQLAGVELAVRIALPTNQQFFARLGYAEVARETHSGYSTPTSITMRKTTTNR